jgi:hypothetical protein
LSRKKESCLYAEIFSNASFPDALLALDRELAAEAKARGCPRCHGVLDVADYWRKPRGGPFALDDAYSRRLSLCCRRDGCRLRVTPPSVRFLGRRVYVSVVVLLCGVLQQGLRAGGWMPCDARWAPIAARSSAGGAGGSSGSGSAACSRLAARTSCRRPTPRSCHGRCWTASSVARASDSCTRSAGWLSSSVHGFRRGEVFTQNLLADRFLRGLVSLRAMADDTSTAERWAYFRHAVIATLLIAPPEPGQLRAALLELSRKSFTHPEALKADISTWGKPDISKFASHSNLRKCLFPEVTNWDRVSSN